MSKTIAILTQPLGHNYGGIIQNFALKRILEKQGFNVKTINRIDENPHSKLKRFLSVQKESLIKGFKKNFITTKDREIIFSENYRFLNDYIDHSEIIENTKELRSHFHRNKYDVVIVGSDQVWRPKYSPNIYDYFLEFLSRNNSIRKIAYASSFGTADWEFTEEETKRCRKLVKEFDAVSVREESGVGLCRKYLDTDAEWVLDPTLLLKKEDYLAVADLQDIPERKGLFSYILDENDTIVSTIEEVCSALGLEHFTNQPKWRRNNKTGKKLEDLRYPSLEGWIKAFDQADFVVTNSFHGTVFSIIFEKPFITIVNKERGASRFYSLLGELGLESRIVEEGEKVNEKIKETVDFQKAKERLEEMKEESLDFLKQHLNLKP